MWNQRHALIMAGGRGTRFWPRSRKRSAKQVLRFFGERSLIQQAVDRLDGVVPAQNIWVITNEYLQTEIREQLPQVPEAQIIAEPSQRNTAPCIGLAAKILEDLDAAAIMGVFPADHLITREDRFRAFVKAAYDHAATEDVVVLGIQPRWAETGYGYIEFPGGTQPGELKTVGVQSFREKPDLETAEKFLEAGNFFWNAGMFFWRAAKVSELMLKFQPETAGLLATLPRFGRDDFSARLSETYPQCASISIDYAVLEKATNVAGIALDDIGWNDVGSWEAVYELADKDEAANVSNGQLIAENASGNYVSANKTVALLGVQDLVVVDTPDALLVGRRQDSQDVSKLVKKLEMLKREELL